jgi:hypothetical protein
MNVGYGPRSSNVPMAEAGPVGDGHESAANDVAASRPSHFSPISSPSRWRIMAKRLQFDIFSGECS